MMVLKASSQGVDVDEPERVWVGCDKLGNLLPGIVGASAHRFCNGKGPQVNSCARRWGLGVRTVDVQEC